MSGRTAMPDLSGLIGMPKIYIMNGMTGMLVKPEFSVMIEMSGKPGMPVIHVLPGVITDSNALRAWNAWKASNDWADCISWNVWST